MGHFLATHCHNSSFIFLNNNLGILNFYFWRLFFPMPRIFLPLLILSIIACCIEVEISVPGFPDIANYFNVSDGVVQLTVAYNFLGFCLSALFYGPLSECYGRRKVMIVGNVFRFFSTNRLQAITLNLKSYSLFPETFICQKSSYYYCRINVQFKGSPSL